MPKHTPGPWAHTGITIFAVGRHTIAQLVEPTRNTSERKPLDLASPKWDEQIANARLISLSPAMRAKLIELVKFCEDNDDGMPGLAAAMGQHAKEIRLLLGLPNKYDADGNDLR